MKLMTPKEIAALLRIPLRSVYRLVFQEELPGIRVGRRLLRFHEADLVAYLKRRKPKDFRKNRHPSNREKACA